MLLATIIVCLVATAAAKPAVVYDQRQDGKYNVEGKVNNMFFLLAVPAEKPPIYDVFNYITKELREYLQSRGGNITVIGSYPESKKSDRIALDGSDVRAEEEIPGRRRFDPVYALQNDLKLQGENCVPDHVRDSVTGLCKDIQPVKIISELELQKQTDLKGVLIKLQPVPDTISS